jgi:hypothetical protein
MKALIRHEGETVLETAQIDGIDWTTGAPLTNPSWAGGPYTLVQNYVPPQDDAPENYEEIVVEPEQVEVEDENDYVVIDGKRYSKEKLRALL